MKWRSLVMLLIFGCVFSMARISLAMNSLNYQVNWDSLNSGGDDISSSTNYQVHDTVGEQATGDSSSALYGIQAGYRTGDADFSAETFSIGTAEEATKIAYSVFSTSTDSVVVSSAASFSVGNKIAVVENSGLNEMVSVGRVMNITGTTLTVDQWNGATSTMSGIAAGGDDFVYRLEGSSAQLGTVSVGGASTAVTATNVASTAPNGYTVSVMDDGNLRTGSDSMTNVSDGAVSLGSEEYGAQVQGQHAVGTGTDFALSPTSTRIIQANTTTAVTDRVALIYKLAIKSSTAAGDYSQVVYYLLTANY